VADTVIEATSLEQANLGKFVPLQTILCCPLSKTPLTLMPLQDLLAHLPESESRRIPLGTVGAFISEYASLAYPIIGDIVDFLEQDTLLTFPLCCFDQISCFFPKRTT
jgi:uncharacterized protein YbaR (Trm112 family)